MKLVSHNNFIYRILSAVLLVFCVNGLIYSQTLKGSIIDAKTLEPIPFANVYFNQSIRGVATDDKGNFELSIEGFTNEPVIISHVGYQSFILQNYNPEKSYRIRLKPEVELLEEITVGFSDKMSREKKLARFKKEFLGTSKNAQECVIENEDNITLVYLKDELTLRAFSEEPIIIRNDALGYRITYFLKSFETSQGVTKYTGFFFFDDFANIPNPEKVEKQRAKTYRGSTMELIRLFWNGKIGDTYQYGRGKVTKSNNYNEYSRSSYVTLDDINYDSLVVTDNSGQKYIKSEERNEVISVINRNIKTRLILLKDSILIDEKGYFDPDGIRWDGYSAIKRVGDQLPYEYLSDKK